MIKEVIILSLSATTLAGGAHAQQANQASASASGLEDIVVTAQKREESLQRTPISMAALTPAILEARGIKDINDLRTSVPGVQITPHPNSGATARIFIRGVGNLNDMITQDPSVAIYLDGVYIARSQGLAAEVAEIERIEVLRGPQGSLYGRNATGGAINYITRAPVLGEFQAKQSLTFGNYDQFRSKTRVNIPLGDTLAVELAYLRSEKDGFVRNAGTGVKRFGDERRDGYRGAVRWQPSEAIDLRYSYDRSDLKDTPMFIDFVPLYPLEGSRPSKGLPSVQNLLRNKIISQGHNLTAAFDVMENLTIKSITGYRKLANRTHTNYSAGTLLGSLNTTDVNQHQEQFSQELQAIGDVADGRFQYVLGAYYFDETGDGFEVSRPKAGTRTNRTTTIDNKAYAVYAQGTLRPALLEGLYATGGLRWSRDDRRAGFDQTVFAVNGTPTITPHADAHRKFSNLSPTFILGYEASQDVNLYAKYAKGYKSGGFNTAASSIQRFVDGFGEESLDSYELGLKSTWLDNRLRFNAAAFLLKYKKIQISLQPDPTNPRLVDTFNRGRAEIKGIEIDLTAKPSDALTVQANYAYVDAAYDKIVNLQGADITRGFYYVESPKNMLTISAEYQFPPTSIGQFSAYVDYYMQSKKNAATTDPRFVVGDYGLLNGRISLSDINVAGGNLRLSAFAKNITNTVYYVAHFNVGYPSAVYGEPRTYGIEASLAF